MRTEFEAFFHGVFERMFVYGHQSLIKHFEFDIERLC